MKLKFIFFLFITQVCLANAQKLIDEPFYSIGSNEMEYFYQSNDTLYVYKCNAIISKKPTSKPSNHYKILDITEKPKNYFVVKIEKLDSLIMAKNPYPDNRFSIHIFKKNGSKELSDERVIIQLTKNEIDNYPIQDSLFNNNFGSTYFSQTYVQEVSKLKKIETEEDAKKIITKMNSKETQELIRNYEKSNMSLYSSNFMDTLISKFCIKLGYNPIRATVILGVLVSKYPEDIKKKMLAEYYK
ncbi:hypothetical protein [Epilithonimonas sp.]|uniref:hypothetical protein n=1 Tax=Epilithonimonas sp. TaxID=2894511 RepID=UPI0035AE5F4C